MIKKLSNLSPLIPLEFEKNERDSNKFVFPIPLLPQTTTLELKISD